jgi:flagella basal body P-ring formation protein FlgA
VITQLNNSFRYLKLLGSLIIALLVLPNLEKRAMGAEAESLSPITERALELLRDRHPEERVVPVGQLDWKASPGQIIDEVNLLQFVSETANGEATFEMAASKSNSLDQMGARDHRAVLKFQLHRLVKVPLRRILPGESLKNSDFAIREINLTEPSYQDWRGNLVPAQYQISSFEAKQTLLEGQPLLASSVQKKPDLRRGDAVKVLIRSSQIQLQTTGVAEENAYTTQNVKIIIPKTKRELLGVLSAPGLVEVTL